MTKRLLAALLFIGILLVPQLGFALRQGRFERYIIGTNGQPVVGASVEIRRQGSSLVQGAQSGVGVPNITLNVIAPGALQTGDDVVIDTGGTSYKVGTVTATTVQICNGACPGVNTDFSFVGGERLSPINAKPTLYIDSNGVTPKGNPFNTLSNGQADCWLGDGIYDYKVSGGGLTTRLVLDAWVGGLQKSEANTWTALQTFDAGIQLPAVVVAPGNLISVDGNDTNLTPDPTCANSGTAGMMTLIDTDESATDVWTVCNGTSTYFVVPNTGADVVADAQILVGNGAGTAAYVAMSGDATITSGGVVTVTAANLNVKVEEMDASPSEPTAHTFRFPNGWLTQVGEAADSVRLQPMFGHPGPLQANFYYPSPIYRGSIEFVYSWEAATGDYGDGAASAGMVCYIPYFNPARFSVSSIAGRMQAACAAGGELRFGLYSANATTGLPDTLLAGGDPLDCVSTAVIEDAVTVTIDPGWYWAAVQVEDLTSGALRAFEQRGAPNLGWDSGNLGETKSTIQMCEAGAWGSGLPATAGVLWTALNENVDVAPFAVFLKAVP